MERVALVWQGLAEAAAVEVLVGQTAKQGQAPHLVGDYMAVVGLAVVEQMADAARCELSGLVQHAHFLLQILGICNETIYPN
jgi:hypothetical protein